jgi:3-deoxy-7-phosphoheptulonate synthase
MIVVMRKRASDESIGRIVTKIQELGFQTHVSKGVERSIIGVIGGVDDKTKIENLANLSDVESVVPIMKKYKLASREFHPDDSVINIRGLKIGGDNFVVVAGPCSVESREQLLESAEIVKKYGAVFLRGGAFKPRTSPYSFQGLEELGLKILAEARETYGLPIVTEIMNPRDIDLVAEYTDVLQVGARNIQNFSLLKELGRVRKPILLKRGMMTTIEEWLMSAEYVMAGGNEEIVLCERGIRTFETASRNTLDLSAVPILKEKTHLPVIVDPSHAVGYWQFVSPLAKAAVAAGADGIMVEVHPRPEEALSDGGQSLKPERFDRMMQELKPFITAAGKRMVSLDEKSNA